MMNREAFLPTIGHFCGLPCILLIYDFTEHKGDLVWLVIMLHQASADHYHKLIACWWYTEHSLEAMKSEIKPLSDGRRGRGVRGAGISIQVVV